MMVALPLHDIHVINKLMYAKHKTVMFSYNIICLFMYWILKVFMYIDFFVRIWELNTLTLISSMSLLCYFTRPESRRWTSYNFTMVYIYIYIYWKTLLSFSFILSKEIGPKTFESFYSVLIAYTVTHPFIECLLLRFSS